MLHVVAAWASTHTRDRCAGYRGRDRVAVDAQTGRNNQAPAVHERSGVGEYWVVDPDLEVVRVYRNEDGRFERPVELRADAGDVLTSPTLAGLEMPLGRIFAD